MKKALVLGLFSCLLFNAEGMESSASQQSPKSETSMVSATKISSTPDMESIESSASQQLSESEAPKTPAKRISSTPNSGYNKQLNDALKDGNTNGILARNRLNSNKKTDFNKGWQSIGYRSGDPVNKVILNYSSLKQAVEKTDFIVTANGVTDPLIITDINQSGKQVTIYFSNPLVGNYVYRVQSNINVRPKLCKFYK